MKLVEVSGDLFSCPPTSSLAHCVSADLRMGKGIATIFKSKFQGLDELNSQKKGVGDVAVLQRDGRCIYYLITKQKAAMKPTYEDLRKSLEAMKQHCSEHSVQALAMPQIGCGLDRLQWPKVQEMIKAVFANTDVNITVYSLPTKP